MGATAPQIISHCARQSEAATRCEFRQPAENWSTRQEKGQSPL